MKQVLKLIIIGAAAGIILAFFLKLIQMLTDNQAYILLFNMDYIPILKKLDTTPGAGMVFHFVTCIASVVALFYMLKTTRSEHRIVPYFFVFTIGGGILFTLTALTEEPPAVTDIAAWFYWILGHAIFSLAVGVLIKCSD